LPTSVRTSSARGRCTEAGTLKTGAEHLKRLAWCEWVRPLITVARADQRLRSFGRKLVAAISPVTSRLHGDLIPMRAEERSDVMLGAQSPGPAAGGAARRGRPVRQDARGR
jgi:hypothetical protein